MARGEGGGGHFDERRRAGGLMDVFGTADAPAPRKKAPAKKQVLKSKPKRVKVESNSGAPAEPGTRMKVTRYNMDKPQRALRPGAQRAEDRMRDPVRLVNPDIPTDWIRSGALEAELRSQRPLATPDPTVNRAGKGNWGGGYTPPGDIADADPTPTFGNYSPGPGLYDQGKTLLNWVKNRNARRMLDT